MTAKRIGNKVEVSGEGIYMYLPANRIGLEIFKKNGGGKEYERLFANRKRIVVRK